MPVATDAPSQTAAQSSSSADNALPTPAPPARAAADEPRPLALAELLLPCIAWLLALLVIWLPALPPSADIPGHMLGVMVHAHPERFQGLLQPNYPLTAWGFVAPTLVFTSIFDPVTAARLVLTLFAALSGIAAWLLAERAGSNRSLAVTAAPLLVLGWPWAMGFWNYLGAMSLGLVAVGLWLRLPAGWGVRALVSSLLLVAAIGHLPGALVCAAWGLFMHLAQRTPRAWLPEWTVMLGPGLVLGAVVATPSGETANLHGFQHAGWHWSPLMQRVEEFFTLAVDGYSPLAAWVCAAALLTLGVQVWHDHGRSEVTVRFARVALLGTGLGFVAFMVLPLNVPDWAYLSPRILPPVVLTGLLFQSVTSIGRRVAGLLLSLAICASLTITLGNAVREGDHAAELLGSLPSSPPGTVYSAIIGIDSGGYTPRYVVPSRGLMSYVQAVGGAGPGAFAHYPAKDIMVYAADVTTLFPPGNPWREWSSECLQDMACLNPIRWADEIAIEALPWQTAFVGGATPELRQRLMERGYVAETSTIWHSRAAELQVDLFDRPDSVNAATLVVQVVWPATVGAAWTASIPASARSARTIYPVRLRVAAGPAELVSCEDSNADGQCGAGDDQVRVTRVTLQPGPNPIVRGGPGAPPEL